MPFSIETLGEEAPLQDGAPGPVAAETLTPVLVSDSEERPSPLLDQEKRLLIIGLAAFSVAAAVIIASIAIADAVRFSRR